MYGGDDEMDAYEFKTRISEKSDIPKELIEFQKKWIEIISESKEIPQWPEKYASLGFHYQGKSYTLSALDLKTNSSMFALFEKRISNDLEKTLGIKNSVYSGFLD